MDLHDSGIISKEIRCLRQKTKIEYYVSQKKKTKLPSPPRRVYIRTWASNMNLRTFYFKSKFRHSCLRRPAGVPLE